MLRSYGTSRISITCRSSMTSVLPDIACSSCSMNLAAYRKTNSFCFVSQLRDGRNTVHMKLSAKCARLGRFIWSQKLKARVSGRRINYLAVSGSVDLCTLRPKSSPEGLSRTTARRIMELVTMQGIFLKRLVLFVHVINQRINSLFAKRAYRCNVDPLLYALEAKCMKAWLQEGLINVWLNANGASGSSDRLLWFV